MSREGKAGYDIESPEKISTWHKYRFVLVILFFVTTYSLVSLFGIDQNFKREHLRRIIESSGVWGFFFFVAIFAIGELLHIPGLVFVAVAMLVYDRLWGVVASFLAAVVSVTVSFIVIRAIGGQAFVQIKRPFIERALVFLESRPIMTVAILRLIFWMAPPLNYALAMTPVKLRDYVIGSAVGLAAPVVCAALFFEWVVENWM